MSPQASRDLSHTARAAHCAVLELPVRHSLAELTLAYRQLMQRWHPDRHQGDAAHLAAAVARTQQITAAYAALSAAFSVSKSAAPQAVADVGDKRAPSSAPGYRAPVDNTYPDGFPDASVLEVRVRAPNLLSVGYNGATSEMYLKFRGDRVYRARGVPRVVFEALLAAPAPGVYADHFVLSRFPTHRC